MLKKIYDISKAFVIVICFAPLMFFFKLEAYFNSHMSLDIKFERIRSVIASELWNRADTLMHRGSINPETQRFQAGSYVGNTDLIPLLKAITYLKPNEAFVYRMLAQSMVYADGDVNKAEKELHRGIDNISYSEKNTINKEKHKLYASIALLKMFYGDKYYYKYAISYLESAIKYYRPDDNEEPDNIFTLRNYYIFLARLYIEIDEPEKALLSLYEGKVSLYSSNDIIFKYLREYRLSGETNKSLFKEENYELSEEPIYKEESHEHHEHFLNNQNENDDIKKSLPFSPLEKALKAGILFFIVISLFAHYKKS